ncbi:EthD family reductase [Allomuricauda sp. SCSIO 65647]|uniref:EthD family reductase n=1 Tax=Allomuricauda sp. SCSIO 65647 TaxID=2908843 RepID=UPI001F4918E8|nr:EthD family reductase [Muricauda sp. SCSIO 65647]UJH67481.1 EthD family reductase [Muricauda sp. SCSIO 65647]
MKTKITLLLFGAAILLMGFQQTRSADTPKIENGMVKVTILYPNGEGKTFDMDYYSTKHMPMAASLFGDAMKAMAIDKGIAGRTPDEPIPYLAIGYFYFDTLADYQNAFGPNAEKIVGDIPNYTNIQPVVQISEVIQ